MTGAPPRIELFLRSLAPTTAREQQERIVERLQRLEAEGEIREFELSLCGMCVCPQSATAQTPLGERLLHRYETFREWADEREATLPGFERIESETTLTEAQITGIVFPRIVLAEYRAGELSFVAPSATGGETTSVTDRLAVYDASSEHSERQPDTEDAAVDQMKQ